MLRRDAEQSMDRQRVLSHVSSNLVPGHCHPNILSQSGYLPSGVRLSAYSSGEGYLPQHVLQSYLDAVAEGTAIVPIDRTYQFEELKEAHVRMEGGLATGKMVVLTGM